MVGLFIPDINSGNILSKKHNSKFNEKMKISNLDSELDKVKKKYARKIHKIL